MKLRRKDAEKEKKGMVLTWPKTQTRYLYAGAAMLQTVEKRRVRRRGSDAQTLLPLFIPCPNFGKFRRRRILP
jgi:hypothetical protein